MNAALLVIAVLLAGQMQPPPHKPVPEKLVPEKPSLEKPTPEKEAADKEPEEKEMQPVFTLDQIAAGAKNDAFVDEHLKDKSLRLFGQVKQIERVAAKDKADAGYRVVMTRLGHEDRAIDVEATFLFPPEARKELALLEPGITKIVIEGTCASTQMQSLVNGLGFMLALKDCKIVEKVKSLEIPAAAAAPRTTIIPAITPPDSPPAIPPLPKPAPLPPRPGLPPEGR
jgi:hypothetical protein